MPAPNYAVINANPDALLAYAQRHVLVAGTLVNLAVGVNIAWVTLTPAPTAGPLAAVAMHTEGQVVDAVELRANGGGAHNAVRAYVCNYVAGQHRSVTVGNAADFVFTTTLNGCTYGIGAAAPNGSRQITHANSGGNVALQRNQIAAAQGAGGVLPAAVRLLEPADYRNLAPHKNLQATVFGIRTGLAWNFYYQVYNVVGFEINPNAVINIRSFELIGVFPVP